MGSSKPDKRGIVVWEKLHRPKDEGGLGIKEIAAWNKAVVGKQIWDLVCAKLTPWQLGD